MLHKCHINISNKSYDKMALLLQFSFRETLVKYPIQKNHTFQGLTFTSNNLYLFNTSHGHK